MSWQALKWAEEQRAGDLSANAVLRVRASHADKNGRGFVGVPEIAEVLQTTKTTVRRADERLIKKSLMKFTEERAGQTLRVKVYQLSLPRNSSATLPFNERKTDAKRTRNSSETVAKQMRNSSATLPSHDTRARVTLNPEPGTQEDKRLRSNNADLLSSSSKEEEGKKSRPALNRPTSEEEVINYLSDDPEFNELRDPITDALWFWTANENNDWKYAGKDWREYAKQTVYARKFPSQNPKWKPHED